VLVASVALCAPTLFGGLALDDYLLFSRQAYPDSTAWPGRTPLDLFSWLDPAHNVRLIDGEGMPWWTYSAARCAFFRPLSSLTHAFDWAVARDSAVVMHLHSVLWFGLLIWVAAKAYASLIDSPWVAAVAAVMFALDSAHGSAIGWISNRNALVAGVFAIATLFFHQRAQRLRSPRDRVLATLSFALALLSGELAVGTLGYLGAYALFCDRRNPWLQRALALVPYAITSVLWAYARQLGHYGSFGLNAYIDPLAEPGEFLANLLPRITVLWASQVARLSADVQTLIPAAWVPYWMVAAVGVCLLSLWLVFPVLRRNAAARFFASGALLSAVPLAATIPADRLLVVTGFGVMPLLAQALHDALQADLQGSLEPFVQKLRRPVAVVLACLHLFVEPLALPVSALAVSGVARWTEQADLSLPVDEQLADGIAIVAAIPDSVLLSYLPDMRRWNGKPRPRKLYWLAATPGQASFERRAPNHLRVSAPQGLFDRRSEARSQHFAFKPGDKVVLSELTIEIVELNELGLPSVCDFVFAQPLDASQYRWQTWRGDKLQPFTVPALGQTATESTS